VDDAALFVSRDDAQTWSELTGLTSHPTRPRWVPGFGGLCLHSIVVDAENARRLWVGISAVGVFRSDDGGETWKLCNNGLPNVAPDFIKDEEMGRCVHKLVATLPVDRISARGHGAEPALASQRTPATVRP
jgi:hypothetical protein